MKHSILRVEKVPDMVANQLMPQHRLYNYAEMNKDQLITIAPDIEVILASGESKVDKTLMCSLPNLKLIAVFGVGYDGVDTKSAFAQGIQVTNTPGVLTEDVADLGMALMLSASRQMIGAQRFIEQGNWQKTTYHLTNKVSRARLGIIGLGRVGQAVAKRAKAFDMDIAYFDKYQIKDCEYKYYADIFELATYSDILMVCASGGAETQKLINMDILEALGKKGILINIARGSIIDEDALVTAINNGIIAGAGLDVFAHEPNVPTALLNRDNVVLTPHIGSATYATRQAMKDLVINNITAFYNNKPLITPVK